MRRGEFFKAFIASTLLGGGAVEGAPNNSMERMQTSVVEHSNRNEQAPFFGLENNKMMAIEKKGMARYVAQIKNLERAFQEDRAGSCTCIDERIPGGQVRLAGSGILLEGGAEAAADMLIAVGATKEVTSHDGCGAAALAKKDGKAFAEEVAKIMSQKLRAPVRHRHITASEMRPPKQFYTAEEMPKIPEYHPGQVVYYDFSGGFNPTQVRELPLGFVSSRRYVGAEVAKHDAKLAIKIALGDHGLGKHFDANPVRVIVVARTALELEQGKAELGAATSEFGKKVVVDGFVIPEKIAQRIEQHN